MYFFNNYNYIVESEPNSLSPINDIPKDYHYHNNDIPSDVIKLHDYNVIPDGVTNKRPTCIYLVIIEAFLIL